MAKLVLNLFNKKKLILGATLRDMRLKPVLGLSNRCLDGLFVITIDYDSVPDFEFLRQELRRIQQDFNIGDFYIFQSSENKYHAICVDKIELTKYITILKNSSCDPNYIYVPLKTGEKIWVLRYSEKDGKSPEYMFTLRNPSNNIKSKAHIDMLNEIYDLGISYPDNDNMKRGIMSNYYI